MQVNKNNITQFLTATNMCFMVPVYQRNYDWTEDNCKQLWADIKYLGLGDTARTHFIGTICSKTTNGHEKTIIDGQQRLTTISLFVKAMHDYVDNTEFKNDLNATFLRNAGYGVSAEHKVKLHLNRRDDIVYNKLLSHDNFTEATTLSADEAASRVYQNYAFFYDCLKGLSEDRIVDLRSVLDRLVIVDLDVEAENPQEIFESLNSTGLDLTDVDLLRNYLLMSLDYEVQSKLYEDYWYRIEQNVHPCNMTRFFVDYLIYVKKSDAMMLRGRRAHVNERNLYAAFKDHYMELAGEGEKYVASEAATKAILSNMYECSKLYKHLVFGDGLDMNSMNAIDRAVYSIVYLNQDVASRPVLLYVMDGFINKSLPEQDALTMLNACLSFVMRSRVVGSTGINGQFAGNMLQRLHAVDEPDCVDAFWQAITSGNGKYAFPSDEEFREALLNRNIFEVLRSNGTKYLLYSLEQNSVSAKGLPRYDDTNITIEHVMPQTLSDDWQDYLGEDVDYYEDYLNRLGNLALTSNNSEMSNRLFDAGAAMTGMDKKRWYAESSFFHTREISGFEEWSISQIRHRGKMLAEKCLSVWSLPSVYQRDAVEAPRGVRRPPFRFSMIGLEPGDEVAFSKDTTRVAVVSDDSHVEYRGEIFSLSGLAEILLGKDGGIAGPCFFLYNGTLLSDLRNEAEAKLH